VSDTLPRMRRLAIVLSSLSLGGLAVMGCQTYRQDLDRAQQHYEQNRYEAALALFRVLEPDMDSYSSTERSTYAYLRGMTDYRLASLAKSGSGLADPKKGFRMNSRHWLGIAAAIDKETPGSLTDDQKTRLGHALKDLNQDVYGGADGVAADAPTDDAAKPKDDADTSRDDAEDRDAPSDQADH
jgi:hypothetical protein